MPCFGNVPTDFVADWVDPSRRLGCDTNYLSINLRPLIKMVIEGYAFDTIFVYRLPELTINNIYCAERDTTYCGVSATPGPFMVAPHLDSLTGMADGTCDTLYFLDYDESTEKCAIAAPATFDPKCGIAVSVGCWEFEDICSPQYKKCSHKRTCV